MNRILTVFLFCILTSAVNAGPFTKFNATKNMTNTTTVTWEQVDDVQKACDAESRRRGLGGFKIQVEACSFWGKRLMLDVCHIITEKKTDFDTLGHEMRHCFQGEFHK